MTGRLAGRRVLITSADAYMGPITAEVFAAEGATIFADTRDVRDPDAPAAMLAAFRTAHGDVPDVIIANLAASSSPNTPVPDVDDALWLEKFEVMVHPLYRLVREFAPPMYARGSGKIVVYGSATAVRPMAGVSAYSTARAAQSAFVKAAGLEAAPHNVQINLIGQNYVENPAYYPPELVQTERFRKHLQRNVPLGRLATAREDALLALFLASGESDFIVGQTIPFSGGWTLQG